MGKLKTKVGTRKKIYSMGGSKQSTIDNISLKTVVCQFSKNCNAVNDSTLLKHKLTRAEANVWEELDTVEEVSDFVEDVINSHVDILIKKEKLMFYKNHPHIFDWLPSISDAINHEIIYNNNYVGEEASLSIDMLAKKFKKKHGELDFNFWLQSCKIIMDVLIESYFWGEVELYCHGVKYSKLQKPSALT